jgi:hypothetical protein
MQLIPILFSGTPMKLKLLISSLSIILLLGCGQKPAQPNTTLSLKQVMGWVIDPNADVIWDSVKSISTAKGTTEIYPRTDAQWESVRNSAAILVEAGNLLMIEGRTKDDHQWMAYAKKLSLKAEVALQAAQNKNKDDLFNAGGDIYDVCKGCHDKYANFDK